MATEILSVPIDGMTCASCAATIERVLGRLEGVVSAQVDFPARAARLEVALGAVTRDRLVAAVRAAGFEVPASRLTP